MLKTDEAETNDALSLANNQTVIKETRPMKSDKKESVTGSLK